MNFSFENQGTHTYLVYTVGENDAIDSMSLGMLTNNKISGLAHTLFTQMDATKFIKYDVSAKVSVKQFFAGQVNKKRLLGVFSGIVDALLSAEDYMIDANSIILDLDYIFADVSTCETVLVCLPIVSDDLSNRDFGAFFKNIMFSTQFDQTENCDHVAKIINYLNSSPVFSLVNFKQVLDAVDVAAAPAQSPQPVVTKATQQRPQQPVPPQPQRPQVQVQQPVQPQPQQNAVVRTAANQAKVTPTPVQQSTPVQQGKQEKEISMFGLLMHYSKENVELYKAQKAAKKSGQAQSVDVPAPQQKKRQQKPQTQAGFAIPGQSAPVNSGFAIPGQQPSVQAVSAQSPAQPVVKPGAAPIQQPVVPPASAPAYVPPVQTPQGQPMNFGETTVLNNQGIGETTVLGAAAVTRPKPYLVRAKNNEKINLDKPVFRIGKEKSYVDYFVADNSAISRSHANIISRDGEYFVVDTNSTNHTYLNGVMLQSNEETPIAHGAKIRLANEDFEFKLY